jgi:hypothetical protein
LANEDTAKRRTPFVELVRRALAARFTGRLDLRAGDVRRRVCVRDGVPVAVHSNLVREHLLRSLLERGEIAEQDFADRLAAVHRGHWDGGADLVIAGIVTPEALELARKEHAAHLVSLCFGWTEADFKFQPLARDHAELQDPVDVDIFGLYITWITANVSRRRLRRQLTRFMDREMRWSIVGLEHKPRLAEQLGRYQGLDRAAIEEWRVSRLLEREEVDFIGLATVVVGLFHLGAIELLRSTGEMMALGVDPPTDVAADGKNEWEVSGVFQETTPELLGRIVDAELVRLREAPDPHAVLGLPRTATVAEVEGAFSKFELFFRPTRFRRAHESVQKAAGEVREHFANAYASLSDLSVPDDVPESDTELSRPPTNAAQPDPNKQALGRILFDDGRNLLKLGDHEAALDALELACSSCPHLPRYRGWRGWAMFLTGRENAHTRNAGVELLESALEQDGQLDDICVLLGHAYSRRGDFERGEAMYRKALELDSENADAKKALAPHEQP